MTLQGAELLLAVLRECLQLPLLEQHSPQLTGTTAETAGRLPLLLDVCCGTGTLGLALCGGGAAATAGFAGTGAFPYNP